MRDNGPRRSFHLRRSNFFLLAVFFSCLPFLCFLLAIQCWLLWQENTTLRYSIESFETEYQSAEARAERLENLEELLREENIQGRDLLFRQLAHGPQAVPAAAENTRNEAGQDLSFAEGPGHEEFPALDSGRVKVDNVQARAMRGNNLRIALDLRNPENEPLLSGEVSATLLTADGQRHQLAFSPQDVGSFKISRFKRTVITTHAPRNVSLADAQVILEVTDDDKKPLYRNIFAVQR